MDAGDRMLLWCEGGPAIGRAVHYPPPLELEVDGGVYVLVDDGPPERWHYQFIATAAEAARRAASTASGPSRF